MRPERRVERFIEREEWLREGKARKLLGIPGPTMTGADWRGTLRYASLALDFAFRDLWRALDLPRLIRRLNRRVAGTWLDSER